MNERDHTHIERIKEELEFIERNFSGVNQRRFFRK